MVPGLPWAVDMYLTDQKTSVVMEAEDSSTTFIKAYSEPLNPVHTFTTISFKTTHIKWKFLWKRWGRYFIMIPLKFSLPLTFSYQNSINFLYPPCKNQIHIPNFVHNQLVWLFARPFTLECWPIHSKMLSVINWTSKRLFFKTGPNGLIQCQHKWKWQG